MEAGFWREEEDQDIDPFDNLDSLCADEAEYLESLRQTRATSAVPPLPVDLAATQEVHSIVPSRSKQKALYLS